MFGQIQLKQKVISRSLHYNDYQKCFYYTPCEDRKGVSQWLDISMHVKVAVAKDTHDVDIFCSLNDDIWHPDNDDGTSCSMADPSLVIGID